MLPVKIAGITVNGEPTLCTEPAGCEPAPKFHLTKREERPDESIRPSSSDPCQAAWSRPPQESVHHGFDLIVGVVSGHEVPSSQTLLYFPKYPIPLVPCPGLRRIGSQAEATDIPPHSVTDGKTHHLLGHVGALRQNPMVHVGGRQIEAEVRSNAGH
jgi:hypothetical protein